MVNYSSTTLSEKDKDFLGYCKIHSQTPRALFSIGDANRLRKMLGLELYDTSLKTTPDFVPIHNNEMIPALEKITEKYRE